MNQLSEVTREPTFLEKLGFTCREEDTTDPRRSVTYRKTIDSIGSQVRFVIQVEFEMWIRDDPFATYTENVSYGFEGVYLRVIDRQMEELDDETYDEETEKPRYIGRFKMNIETVSHLRLLCKMLSQQDLPFYF